jgi:hypothetical protein
MTPPSPRGSRKVIGVAQPGEELSTIAIAATPMSFFMILSPLFVSLWPEIFNKRAIDSVLQHGRYRLIDRFFCS